ncbi:MAG: hypothetical protein KDC33_09170 [Thermoleophilia bacterium]|nr:hypothetical protein [Thermoleophilia bacterium]
MRDAPSPAGADWFACLGEACREINRRLCTMDRAERTRQFGRGAGGDTTVGVDRVAEDILIDALRRRYEETGDPVTLVSEEAGLMHVGGPGGPVVIADPIDGSRNAARGAPLFATSIAVSDDRTMGGVRYALVFDHGPKEVFTAERGVGAWLDGACLGTPERPDRLRMLAVEGASAARIAAAALTLVGEVGRLRSLGSMALSMCWIAAGRMDALLGLGEVRAVDVAAAQLVLREVGCWVGLPEAEDVDDCPLDVVVRRRVMATAQPDLIDKMRRALGEAAAVSW